MKHRILCGNAIDGNGSKISDCMNHFEFESSYCANNFRSISKELTQNDYDGLIFFLLKRSDKIADFVLECHLKYPNLKIYLVVSGCSASTRIQLQEAGAARCIAMPYNEYSVCAELINDFHSGDELPILPEVAEFLFKKGFPNDLTGFYHLCCILEKSVTIPGILGKPLFQLYEITAKVMDTTACNVERAVRVLSSAAFKKGVTINGQLSHKRLQNKKLISALSKEYALEFGFEIMG